MPLQHASQDATPSLLWQAKYGFIHECLELTEGIAVLHRPARRRANATILYIPGYGRNFDAMALAEHFRDTLGVDLCGLDFHGYGVAYRLERSACKHAQMMGKARQKKPRDCGYCNYKNINEYFEDLDVALSNLCVFFAPASRLCTGRAWLID